MRNGSLEQALHPHVTPEQTPRPSPERDAQALEIALGPSKGISRAQPFDMWAAQNGSAEPSEQVRASTWSLHLGRSLAGGQWPSAPRARKAVAFYAAGT